MTTRPDRPTAPVSVARAPVDTAGGGATPVPAIIACGALASELRAVLGEAGLTDRIEIVWLPANLHNRPERIAPAVAEALAGLGDRPVFVAYADCGTGGALDAVLAATPGVQRLPGAHCYEVFADRATFAALQEAEAGTFYLTDFLARHFDALVWAGLGLDRHPELRDAYFGHYRRLVHLDQAGDPAVVEMARSAAQRLGLEFRHVPTGREGLATPLLAGLSALGVPVELGR